MSDGDRKYRQRGYQDTGRSEERGSRPPQRPRERPEGPRGRGLGRPTESVFRCAACGEKRLLTGAADEVPVDAACARCGADLHACANCPQFDTGVRWECRRHAEIPARVPKKRARNECPLFEPKTVQEFGSEGGKPGPDSSGKPGPADPRAAFDALFKL